MGTSILRVSWVTFSLGSKSGPIELWLKHKGEAAMPFRHYQKMSDSEFQTHMDGTSFRSGKEMRRWAEDNVSRLTLAQWQRVGEISFKMDES